MHGIIQVPGNLRDIVPASFPLGRVWIVAFASHRRMTWVKEDDRYGPCFAVERDIAELGLETFVPPERRIEIRKQRKQEIITPAFGPYVFVCADREADEWKSLKDLDGVHGVLKNADIPVRVPDILIERIRRAEQAGAFDKSKVPFEDGEDVEIMEGQFAGLIGKVKSASPGKRAKILLNALGSVDIDACFLRKI